MPLVPAGNATIGDIAGGLEVVIPAPRSAPIVLFLGFSLIGWACAEFFVIRALIPFSFARLDGLLWLVGWTAGDVLALYTCAWVAFGRERVILKPAALTLSREILGHVRNRHFDLANVTRLRAASFFLINAKAAFPMQTWALFGGSIEFDYGGRTIRFGASLDEAEARRVVSALATRNPLLSPPNTVAQPTCPDCRRPMESGSLLVVGVSWSTDPNPFMPETLFPMARPGLYVSGGRPVPLSAARCAGCGICITPPDDACTHKLVSGWVFPSAKLRWVPHGSTFIPTFLFPFSSRGRGGVMAETLFSPGFRLSLAGTRCPARRCSECGAVIVQYGRRHVSDFRPAIGPT